MKTMTLIKCAVLAVSLAVPGIGQLTAADTNSAASSQLSPLAKARTIKVDSCFFDSLPLREVIGNLNDQARMRDPDQKGVKISVATTAPTYADTLITLQLKSTNLAEILNRVARQANLDLVERDGGLILAPKKQP